MTGAVIIGTGSFVPERVLTNNDLEKIVNTSDTWITTRTGIKTRRIAGPGEETAKMGAEAARKALKMSGLRAGDIDMIIVATFTPDMAMPSCACLIQKELQADQASAFDLNAACSGFVFGLDVADKYVRSNPALKILLIGAETLSARVNWGDRNTCVLFGDGAGACVITGGDQKRGVIASELFSDGRLWELLYLANEPRRLCPGIRPADNYLLTKENGQGSAIHMEGRDVFKYAVRAMEQAVTGLLDKHGTQIDDVSLMIPHQANIRILKSLVERLGLPPEKVYIIVQKYGNTSAASVPIALDEAHREGKLNKGELLLLCVFGGGFTWGTTLIRW